MHYATSRDGVRIHYVTEGNGRPLVLHHCLVGSHADWHSFGFVAGLRGRYRLILVDARGHGASDKPPGPYSFEQLGQDILAVLDDQGIEQAHYYGYSLGGMVGWELGRQAPERFLSMAIGGAQPYRQPVGAAERIAVMRHHLAQGMAAYVEWSESRVGAWPAEFRARALQHDAEALQAHLPADPEVAYSVRFDDALERMTMPVLLLSGDRDEGHAGSRARRAAESLLDARFVEIPNADHFALYASGERLVLPHLRAFLDGQAAEAGLRKSRAA
ncbi:MAG TPA: alpha/beta hydrolase [Thermomicrobiales bacterium]|nr:alpha/beta hydrolase [Thermomicrobiales bacterium]